MPFAPPLVLIAAILSMIVYHDPRDIIVPPPGWEKVGAWYDGKTGYYGEAWGEIAKPKPGEAGRVTFDMIMQVNRGTIFPATGPNRPQNVPSFETAMGQTVPAFPLQKTAKSDSWHTLLADLRLMLGRRPAYVISAERFHDALRRSFGRSMPIMETGHSLGGAPSDAVVAMDHKTDPELSADAFNPLVYGNATARITVQEAMVLPVENFYVSNELLTRNFLMRTALALTAGKQVGALRLLPRLLPDKDHLTEIVVHIVSPHLPASSVSQVFLALYDDRTSPLYQHPSPSTTHAALQWLRDRFPEPTARRPQISAVLKHGLAPAE